MLNIGSRSVFVDVARAAAIMMMVQGHTLHVVLATDLRSETVFYVWSFLRGLTSSTFLLLSGFVFALATHRHWTDQFVSRATTGRRFRRLGFFLLLGYALHFPMAKLGHLYGMSDERWKSFFVVDVLQCIAVMLATLQVLVWLVRKPHRHTIAAAVGCAMIIAFTPTMWRIDWTALAPTLIAAYLSPATGSPFPLFPWGAYILLGAALGGLYVRSRMDPLTGFADRVLIGGGLGMLLVAFVCVRIPLQPFGPTDFWTTSPNQFLVRAGCMLLALGLLAQISRLISKPAYAVQALAHESLTVYAVHLGVVYGSAWNLGLRQHVGPTLTLWPALAYVAAMWASMTALASGWHWCKHRQPGIAQWVRVGVGGLLLGRLL